MVSELLTLRTDYAAKIDADLELVEKDRERVRAEITALQDQLHTLEGNHALLPSMREALPGHSPAAYPEPGPDGAASTGSSPAAPPASDGVSVDGRAFTPATALRPGEQVQVDTTRLDVLALFDAGRLARPELTSAVDVAARAILAAVPCPSATKAVDAALLLLAEMAVPHPARPMWPDILDHAPALPHQRPTALDERLTGAAARPFVLPETIVVNRGKVFVSAAFTAACEHLGISAQPAPPRAPTAKGIVERTFDTINALFRQHLPG
ncbi:hypothetical protein [Streptomyces cinerochromogenes]|uniref:hypothetical protein n=1 Tax=Streptomyces cinerochromogenes TaxID=66422 RepID=UPI0033A15D21